MQRSIATDACLLMLGITIGFAGTTIWIKPQSMVVATPVATVPVPQPALPANKTKTDADIELFNQLMMDLPLFSILLNQQALDASKKELLSVSLETKVLSLHRAFMQLNDSGKQELAMRLLENSSLLLKSIHADFNKERQEFWRGKPTSEQVFNAYEFLINFKQFRNRNRNQF